MMDFRSKYIQYKQKYLGLKNSIRPIQESICEQNDIGEENDIGEQNNISEHNTIFTHEDINQYDSVGGTNKKNSRTKHIYFIRHGETEWNVQGLSQGSTNDIPLNAKGVKQSIKTGKYLAKIAQDNNFSYDVILSSPMKRTLKTAQLIAQEINYSEKIITNSKLVENGTGLISVGKTIGEMKQDEFYNDFFKQMNQYNELDIIGKNLLELDEFPDIFIDKYNIESNKKRYHRGNHIIKLLEKSSNSRIIVISHNGFIDIINKILLNTTDNIKGNMSNGTNCHLTYYQLDSDNNWKLICAPNTLHLG
jgi:broad specificity phosphatase PhoE